MSINRRNHNHTTVCPYCPPKSNEPILTSRTKTKIMSFLGVCGCISCYVAMFPAILLGVIGILGISQLSTISALNAYAASALFQPILIASIVFLIVGIIPYWKAPLWLSILGGIGIFVSMNFYMREWLFTFSFVLIAFAYFLALRHTKTPQLKFAFVLLTVVVMLGVIDTVRSFTIKTTTQHQTQPQRMNNNTMNMMNRR